ncbi:TAR DNA-binding protein 43-like [Saccoglossus kowalevskii]
MAKMSMYLKVADKENGEPIELPLKHNRTLLLSTLQAQFLGASGLRYRPRTTASDDRGCFRGIKLDCGVLCPPRNEWDETCPLFVVYAENKNAGTWNHPDHCLQLSF